MQIVVRQLIATAPKRLKINKLKVQIALVRGKKLYDKRESLKKKQQLKDAQSAMKEALYK